MKFLQVILSLSVLLLVPLLVVESSSSLNDISATNITRGSFLYSNDTSPYWLSPSGNIAFGLYPLPWSPDQYTVGIWFVNSCNKTLVWTANLEDLIPMNKPSAILFTKEGKLVLRMLLDNKEKPLLLNAPEPVSYAKLHDNGNFVLYGSDSQIVWESFDYPTDTLLGGQKIKAGYHLNSNSGDYKLSMSKISGIVMILDASDFIVLEVSSRPWFTQETIPENLPASLNLDTSGMLYLANSDGALREIIYKDKKQQRNLEDRTINNVKEDYIYRATLDSSGYFILYKERIDGNEESSSSLVLLWASYQLWSDSEITLLVIFILVAVIIVGGVIVCIVVNKKDKEQEETRKKEKEKTRKSSKGGYEAVDNYELSELELGEL